MKNDFEFHGWHESKTGNKLHLPSKYSHGWIPHHFESPNDLQLALNVSSSRNSCRCIVGRFDHHSFLRGLFDGIASSYMRTRLGLGETQFQLSSITDFRLLLWWHSHTRAFPVRGCHRPKRGSHPGPRPKKISWRASRAACTPLFEISGENTA